MTDKDEILTRFSLARQAADEERYVTALIHARAATAMLENLTRPVRLDEDDNR